MSEPAYWDGDHPDHGNMVQRVSEQFEQAQADKPAAEDDPGPDMAWFDAIADAERSGKDGWEKWNKAGGGIGALGRYQVRKAALKDAGFLDKNGKWTGKGDAWNIEGFLKNPSAQNMALRDYSAALDRQIKSKGLESRIGQTIKGVLADIEVTQSGLAAAAHRHGAGGVREYFRWLDEHQGNSRDHLAQMTDHLKEIESRLRTFQNVPYKNRPMAR
ncbi:MAG TPA: hypothetical protein VFS04_00640 [Alphaproteobacteria bacterium]|nr:hypothetical protein [Alphaproteobacteria bacterium]